LPLANSENKMNRYFIQLAYNGKNYHGWQMQENAHTVQAEINEKLSLLLGESINVTGCGRTDAGVHARQFFAHFEIENLSLDPDELTSKLNNFLSKDIAVYKIFKVKPDMHARFSATSRTYRYYISKQKNPFLQDLSYFYHVPLNLAEMKKASSLLLNYTDFTSFSKLHSQTNNNNCKISFADWEETDEILIFTITADRFLRNMVRAIVGTLLEVGKGKMEASEIKIIIELKNRSEAGFSVPAEGLFLEKIEYPF
jgi:tRNA pseudouridine38-40 synthase